MSKPFEYYLHVAQEGSGGKKQDGVTQDPGKTLNNGGVYSDEISKAVKAGNYKDYFNAAVQNRVMGDYERKYLTNTLANQGLNNTGYGNSAMVGIGNKVINANADAYNAYVQANAQADQAALSRQEDNIDSLLAEITAGGQMGAELNQYLVNAGYMDPNGNYTDAFNQLTSAQQTRIKNAMATANATQGNTGEAATGISLDALKARTFGDDVDAQTFDSKFNYELTALNNAVNNGNVNAGEVIKMTNGNTGETAYVRYNADGTYSIVSENDYNKANLKSEVKNGRWVQQTKKNATQEMTADQKMNDKYKARYGKEPYDGARYEDKESGYWFRYNATTKEWKPFGKIGQ